MPELKCTVQTCVHNKQYYCDLDHIQVGGEHAKRADETCCDSFEERTGDTYSNVTGQASATSNIRCEATECRYNQSCKWKFWVLKQQCFMCHIGKKEKQMCQWLSYRKKN